MYPPDFYRLAAVCHDELCCAPCFMPCCAAQLFPELLKDSPYVVDDPAQADWLYVHVWPYYSHRAIEDVLGFADKVRCAALCCGVAVQRCGVALQQYVTVL